MLSELSIRNLAVIESARMDWSEGFTVITGETGAGKSILMNALKILLGARVKGDLIRRGADRLKVEAVFDLPTDPRATALLAEWEIDTESGELVIEREIHASGKNRCRLNGVVVPVGRLDELGRYLVELCGQHQQQALIHSSTHLGFLDGFAGLQASLARYRENFRQLRDIMNQILSREAEHNRVQEQQDFYRFQFQELEKARLKPGEEEQVEQDLKVQGSLEKIQSGVQNALSCLEGQDWNLEDKLGLLGKELNRLEQLTGEERFRSGIQKAEEAVHQIAEVRRDLEAYPLPDSISSEKLDQLNGRMAFLQRLQAKYQTNVAGLIELREKRRQELEQLANTDADLGELKEAGSKLFSNLLEEGRRLSQERKKASKVFDGRVHERLASLGMEGSRFETRIQGAEPIAPSDSSLGSNGWDQVEFFLAANPGEDPKPLKTVASGGEASRIMLAIKAVLAQIDTRPLLVFDEIDTGIGGTTAKQVGETLKELAEHHQLFVITHLHQVAACATHHRQVVKSVKSGKTLTEVKALDEHQRVAELARMMGDAHSSSTLQHARELLSQE